MAFFKLHRNEPGIECPARCVFHQTMTGEIMDPEQTLSECETALHAGRLEEAQTLLGVFACWKEKGGFLPVAADARERRLRLLLHELLAEESATYRGFQVSDLRLLFGEIANRQDWRGPIRAEVRPGNRNAALVRKIVAAVAFFTATDATVREIRDGNGKVLYFEVTAAGYRAGPAGDH
jgi:hypothetical protein